MNLHGENPSRNSAVKPCLFNKNLTLSHFHKKQILGKRISKSYGPFTCNQLISPCTAVKHPNKILLGGLFFSHVLSLLMANSPIHKSSFS